MDQVNHARLPVLRPHQRCIRDVRVIHRVLSLPFAKFAECLRAQSSAANLLITCCELFKDTAPDSAVVRATMGILGHQYNVATVTLPDGRQTHIRADYYAVPPPGCSSRLLVACNDNHDELTRGGHLISRIAAPPRPDTGTGAPTLQGLGALFDVAHTRLGDRPYDLFGRNCFWMTDMLFYTVARRYARYWLAGAPTPEEPLRRYLRGEAGALGTAVACATPDEAARFWATLGGNVVRGIQVFFSGGHEKSDRFMMHDQEVTEWIEEWAHRAYMATERSRFASKGAARRCTDVSRCGRVFFIFFCGLFFDDVECLASYLEQVW
ncbi:hypothetical protein C2E23DRAFT_940105 [Lenzites betulinus]|nr:hypothetical protein C2E23DRAFT_940105 [Lenzites betulinus]